MAGGERVTTRKRPGGLWSTAPAYVSAGRMVTTLTSQTAPSTLHTTAWAATTATCQSRPSLPRSVNARSAQGRAHPESARGLAHHATPARCGALSRSGSGSKAKALSTDSLRLQPRCANLFSRTTPGRMKPSTFLSLYDKLEKLVQRLPDSLQQPILREITPIKTLFLLQRPPRLVLLGPAGAGKAELLLGLLARRWPGPARKISATARGRPLAGKAAAPCKCSMPGVLPR